MCFARLFQFHKEFQLYIYKLIFFAFFSYELIFMIILIETYIFILLSLKLYHSVSSLWPCWNIALNHFSRRNPRHRCFSFMYRVVIIISISFAEQLVYGNLRRRYRLLSGWRGTNIHTRARAQETCPTEVLRTWNETGTVLGGKFLATHSHPCTFKLLSIIQGE